jgi:hypothetical protein
MVLIRNSFSRNKNRMQIAKRFLVVCAATISFTVVTHCAMADDSDAQAKAREALDKRLNEMQSQPAQPTPAPQTPPKPKVKKPKAAAQPKPTPPPPQAPARPQPPAQPVAPPVAQVTTPPPPAPPEPTPPPAPAPVAKPQPKAAFSADATAPAESEAAARERAALESRLNQLQSQQPVAPQTQPGVQPRMEVTAQPTTTWQPSASAHVAVAAPEPPKPPKMSPKQGFAPLQRPESPLSPAKEQQLQELLRKYRADQITPEQYHAERARILAEP